MSKSREKQFAKNTLILSIGTLGSKIFTFFLLPLYTAVLTTEDYGNVDVLQSTIQLAVPIITLQLSAATFRFLIERKTIEDKAKVITDAIVIVGINVIISIICFCILYIIHPFAYFTLFVLSFAASALYTITQSIVRGFGHNALYSFCGFISVLSSLLTNVILILGFGKKGSSILVALIVSNTLTSVIMILKEQMWKYVKVRLFDKDTLKELLQYSLPLIPNQISWWIANASDRFLILAFLGSSFNGIYAAANKISGIFVTIFNVFNLAWQESMSRSVNDSDRDSFVNGMINRCYRIFVCLCLGIISSVSVFFDFLFGVNYRAAYPHVYILTIAIFFNSMCALYGGIFTAFKKSKIIGSTTAVGAVANIIINFSLIRIFGLYAASVSTLISYLIVFIIRVWQASKLIHFKWPIAYFLRTLIAFVVISVGYFYRNNLLNIVILTLTALWSIMENKDIVWAVINGINEKVRNRRQA